VTSHSEHGKFVRGYAATVLDEIGPVSTGASRDGVVNNVRHLIDEAPQVFVNFALASGEYRELSTPDTAVYRPIELLPFFEFPLPLKPNSGDSILVVPYLRVSLSGNGDVTFRVVLRLRSSSFGAPYVDGTTKNISEFNVTASAAAYVAPDPVYLPASMISGPSRISELPSLKGDGTSGEGAFLFASLSIWAISDSPSILPRVHGVYARGYIGD
jgi:hypothetical protein